MSPIRDHPLLASLQESVEIQPVEHEAPDREFREYDAFYKKNTKGLSTDKVLGPLFIWRAAEDSNS
jgi:hypothetical protein